MLLKRIAMARFGRRACAGLTGEAWLAWLEDHDPNRFPWRSRGRPLIDWPYAPPDAKASADALRPLVGAAHAWLQAEAPPAGGLLGKSRLRLAWHRLRTPWLGQPVGGVEQHV